jgi:hypothetical protein
MKTAIAVLVYFAATVFAVVLYAPSFAWTTLLLFMPTELMAVLACIVLLRLHVFMRGLLPEVAAGGWWAVRERMQGSPAPLRELLDGPWSWGLSAPAAGTDVESYLRQAKRQMFQFSLAVLLSFTGTVVGMMSRFSPGGISP